MKVCHGAPNLVKIGQKKKFGYFPCKPKYFPTAARDTNSQQLDDRMSPHLHATHLHTNRTVAFVWQES